MHIKLDTDLDFIEAFKKYSINYKSYVENRDWILYYPIEVYIYAYEHDNIFQLLTETSSHLDNLNELNFFFNEVNMMNIYKIDSVIKKENSSIKLKIGVKKYGSKCLAKVKLPIDFDFLELYEAILYNSRFSKIYDLDSENSKSYVVYKNNCISFKTVHKNHSTKFKLHNNKYNIYSTLDSFANLAYNSM